MSSMRISAAIRDGILRGVIQHRYDQAVAEAKAAMYAAGLAWRKEHFGELMVAQMDALPPGWLPTDDDQRAQMGDSGYNYLTIQFGEQVRVRYCDRNSTIKVPLDDPAFLRYKEKHVAYHELCSERDQARNELEAIIARKSSVGALLKEWPELEPFVEAHSTGVAKAAQLPALPREELNARFGLPTTGGVVDGLELTDQNVGGDSWPEWACDAIEAGLLKIDEHRKVVTVHASGGVYEARVGEWVVQYANGGLDVFITKPYNLKD